MWSPDRVWAHVSSFVIVLRPDPINRDRSPIDWHVALVEDRCAPDEDCANSANEAQVSKDKTGTFQWVQYRDLEKSDICSWEISPDAPNTLDFDDCNVDPDGNSDTFVYRLSGKALILTGLETNPLLTN